MLRVRAGASEDRSLATVFYGIRILLLAMTFLAAALVGGLLPSFHILPASLLEQGGLFVYGRSVLHQVFQPDSIRMAAVFMRSLGTI